MTLDKSDLLTKLQSVSEFSVTASDANNWSATGSGMVSVEQSADNILVWRETGIWDKGLAHLEFSNTYRWTRTHDKEFQLEHLRYGIDQPVKLVDIRSLDEDHWRSTSPHYCGQDKYFLDLNIKIDQLILDWKIKGPNKDQHSTIYYR